MQQEIQNPCPRVSVHEILQARILECVAISSSRGSSQPRNQTQVSCFAGGLYHLSYQGSPGNSRAQSYTKVSLSDARNTNTCLRVSHFHSPENFKAIDFESAWEKCLSSGIHRGIDGPNVAAVTTGQNGNAVAVIIMRGLLWWASGQESTLQCKGHGFDSCSVNEGPTCHKGAKPLLHNYSAHMLQSLHTTTRVHAQN